MNDSISILEQLVTAIEQAGVNVAPTYQGIYAAGLAIATVAEKKDAPGSTASAAYPKSTTTMKQTNCTDMP